MSYWSVVLTVSSDDRDAVIADLWEFGTTGITEDTDVLRAFFDENSDRGSILARFAAYAPAVDEHDDHDWVAHAQSMWQPVAVGKRLWLAPEWDESPAPEGRLRIAMRSGLACGSGWHPATQLCLEALEELVHPGTHVLDVGVGSGILSDAAHLLGAAFVAGCDIDHDATRVAQANVAGLPVFMGSLRSVRSAAVDIIVANLNAATIASMPDEFARVARAGVILSGFPEEEADMVRRKLDLHAAEIRELDGWACLIAARRAPREQEHSGAAPPLLP